MTQIDIPQDTLLKLYRQMLLVRSFEMKLIELYPEQEIKTPVHLCIGQEAIAVGVCHFLLDSDYMFSTHRNHGHCIAKGMSLKKLFAELYGRENGCSGGKGGSMHPVDPEHGILGTTAIVGGGIPIAAGTALSSVLKRDGKITVVFFGDGAAEEGTFHETLNFAVLKKLPIVFVCENNLYATASPLKSRQPAASSIVERARSYGMESDFIDGNNIYEVYNSMAKGEKTARSGKGPYFIEAETYRWMPHVGTGDDTATGHRPAAELAEWKSNCPLERTRQYLSTKKWFDSELVARDQLRLEQRINDAVLYAKSSKHPDINQLLDNVMKR